MSIKYALIIICLYWLCGSHDINDLMFTENANKILRLNRIKEHSIYFLKGEAELEVIFFIHVYFV